MKVLLCYAIEEERISGSAFPSDWQVREVVTGIGKANAAMRLTRALMNEMPDIVINIGTAGTSRHEVGDIVVSSHFVDRDFEHLPLPGLCSEIYGGETACTRLFTSVIGGVGQRGDYIVNTGDNFVVKGENLTGDVIDMEAFAEALACSEAKVPFFSIKYITDVVGRNSVKAWQDKLAEARASLSLYLTKSFSIKNM